MGLTIQDTKAGSLVIITVARPLDRKHDDGPARKVVKESATTWAEAVIGEVVSVRHNIEGARNNRSMWTIEARTKASLAMVDGGERRAIVKTIKDSAEKWAAKQLGRGTKVTIAIE